MKKLFNFIKNKKEAAKNAVMATVASVKAEGYVDTGVKIIISVVIGGVILAGLYTLFNGTIIPNLNTEIGQMFNYSGT